MNDWPHTEKEWEAYAARCTAHYPLMLTNWDLHAKQVKAKRNRQLTAALEAVPDQPPLTPEEEEIMPAPEAATLF